jgi:hypothetical protein
MGFQGQWQVLQAWESKACRQKEFWGLISLMGLWELNSVALLLTQESKACGQW